MSRETVDTPPPYETVQQSSNESEWLRIQRQAAQQATTTSRREQALNAAGNAAFTAGTSFFEMKESVSSVDSVVKKVLGDTRNEVLNNMIQLADKLVDVGKAVPIISPAFVIIKLIIDIETKAREADEKCQDLMERINFMISHVLVLEKIEIIDTLRTVLQKLQDVLKEAAALIEAYRKQGKIARRLKVSNTQNFETMAGKITGCTSDLMMSLQIQQTGDLSILKRSVPRDLVAESFIREHGGQDAITNNPAIVKEFAEKAQLVMSDKVMEQLQSSMQELMELNRCQIENTLREASDVNVANMIKAIATQQRELEAERKLTCVQCEKEYNVSMNGPDSCKFHSAVGNFGRFNCCERQSPCKTGYHQPEHHSKYPYSAFFMWSWTLLGYKDTVDYWLDIKEMDLEYDDSQQVVRIGQLMRWRSGALPVTTPLLLVDIGLVRDNLSFYLEIFDAATLEDERQKVIRSGNSLIFKNAPEDETKAFSMGEWVLDEDTKQITGIKVTVKVTNCILPTICFVPIDPMSLKMPPNSSLKYLSKAESEIFKPDGPYKFPPDIQKGPKLRETKLREPRTFKSKSSSSNIPLVLFSPNQMVANNNVMLSNFVEDRFVSTWRGLNNSPVADQKRIVLTSAKAEYRLIGEKEYKPVKAFGLRNKVMFPLTIAPEQALDIPLEFIIDKPQVVAKRSRQAINFAHLTVHHPLRVRITFTDIEGETVSLVQEYVHPIMGITKRDESQLGYFFVDDVDICERTLVTITKPIKPEESVVNMRGGHGMTKKVTELDLRRMAHKAQKTGETQVELKVGESNLGINWTAWALVDLSCKRVYGFKVLLLHGAATPEKYAAYVGYAPCPLYGGDNLETRPIQYAKEIESDYKIVSRSDIVVVEDDTLDDEIPETLPKPLPEALPEALPAVTMVVKAPLVTYANSTPLSQAHTQTVNIAAATTVPVTTSITPSVLKPSPQASSIPNLEKFSVATAEAPKPEAVSTIIAPALPSITAIPPVSPPSSSLDSLHAKIAVLEARLEAAERHDALMLKIIELEKKLEARANVAVSPTDNSSQGDRISVLESRLASMDKKMDDMNINLRLIDGNASRLATSLEKIAGLLSI